MNEIPSSPKEKRITKIMRSMPILTLPTASQYIWRKHRSIRQQCEAPSVII